MIEKALQSSSEFQNLCKTLAKMDNSADVGAFLRDVLTYKEIKGMGERLSTAKLLENGLSYREIQDQTGTSTTTVTRVSQWLNHGCGGYQKALKIMK